MAYGSETFMIKEADDMILFASETKLWELQVTSYQIMCKMKTYQDN